jgi:hypothetical protein
MAQAPTITVTVRYRRTIRWTLGVMGIYALKAIGLKMPKRLLLWLARAPMQCRVGDGPWRTIRLDPAELRRRFG